MKQPISIQLSQHQSAGYSPASKAEFAANDAVAPIVFDELAQACGQMVIGFQCPADQGAIELVALQSLVPGFNAYVMPNGRWLAGYMPSYYRGWPFSLQPGQEPGQLVLSVEQEAIVETVAKGDVAFFSDQELSEPVKKVAEFLTLCIKSRQQTLALCKQLAEHNLIVPWPITYTDPQVSETAKQTLNGIWRIDEQKLASLPAEQLAALAATGALKLAYAQILSAAKLQQLSTLFNAKRQYLAGADNSEPDLEELFGSGDELLSF